MLPALYPLAGVKRSFKEQFALCITASSVIEDGQVVEAFERIGMIPAQHAFAGRDCPNKERFGFRIAALELIDQGQIIHTCERMGVLRAKHTFTNRKHALIERFRLAVTALGLIKDRKIVHADKSFWVLLPECSLRECHGLLSKLDRVCILSLAKERSITRVEGAYVIYSPGTCAHRRGGREHCNHQNFRC
jgi:hypothetical protein